MLHHNVHSPGRVSWSLWGWWCCPLTLWVFPRSADMRLCSHRRGASPLRMGLLLSLARLASSAVSRLQSVTRSVLYTQCLYVKVLFKAPRFGYTVRVFINFGAYLLESFWSSRWQLCDSPTVDLYNALPRAMWHGWDQNKTVIREKWKRPFT